MNFLFTLNASYLEPLCVCLKSIAGVSDESNDYYIAHNSLSEIDIARINRELSGSEHKAHFIRIGDELFDGLKILKHTSKETYYRLLCMDYLPKEVDRVLYLDPDIVCINSLRGLYDTDMNGYYLAMASHMGPFMHWFNSARLRFPKTFPYFNAGVVLFNLKELRRNITGDMVLTFMNTTKVHLDFADQDVLNVMFYTKIKLVDTLIYNLDRRQFRRKKLTLDDVRKNSAIIHYDGKDKPWNDNCENELKVFYEEVIGNEKIVRFYSQEQVDATADNVCNSSDCDNNILRKV